MSNRAPPLHWVRVFESAARHGNFVAAAKELSVSPGAVSRTVKELERFVGTPLFVRSARGVRLTDAARAYARAVSPALMQIAAAAGDIADGLNQPTVLRVLSVPALAQRWLIPRLADFRRQCPGIDLHLEVSASASASDAESFDVVLRNGSVSPADCVQLELFADEPIAVLSPDLRRQAGVREPRDIFRLLALQDLEFGDSWPSWVQAAGLLAPAAWHSMTFGLHAMAIDAALAGLGVLMARKSLVQSELACGLLVAPFATRMRARSRYYAVAARSRASSPVPRAFLDWLHTQVNGNETLITPSGGVAVRAGHREWPQSFGHEGPRPVDS